MSILVEQYDDADGAIPFAVEIPANISALSSAIDLTLSPAHHAVLFEERGNVRPTRMMRQLI